LGSDVEVGEVLIKAPYPILSFMLCGAVVSSCPWGSFDRGL